MESLGESNKNRVPPEQITSPAVKNRASTPNIPKYPILITLVSSGIVV